MKISYNPSALFSWGQYIALGMAWHLDNGPCIIVDWFLGWTYVAYKITQMFWPLQI